MALEETPKPHRELKSPEPQAPSGHAHMSQPRVMQSADTVTQGQVYQVRQFRERLASGGVEPDETPVPTNYITLWGRGFDILDAMVKLNELVNQAIDDGFEPQGGIEVKVFELGSAEADHLGGLVHMFQAVRRVPYIITTDKEEENDYSDEVATI